jgi:hypothetical protein
MCYVVIFLAHSMALSCSGNCLQHKDHKRREEYWAAGVGYGHHNRPGLCVVVFLVIVGFKLHFVA